MLKYITVTVPLVAAITFSFAGVASANSACSGDCAPGLAEKTNPPGNPDTHGTATGPGNGDPRGRAPVDDAG